MKRIYIILFLLLVSVLTRGQSSGLDRIESFVPEGQVIITWEAQPVSIIFKASDLSDIQPTAMQAALENYLMSNYSSVVKSVTVQFVNPKLGRWIIEFWANNSASGKSVYFSLPELVIVQSPKNTLLSFPFTGENIIPEGGSVTLRLAYSQKKVKYSLLKDGNVVEIVTSLGYGISFNGITEPGVYTVRAEYNDLSLMMDGSVTVTNFNPLNEYTISGGGDSYNGANVALTLSGSQSGVQYRLLKNGVLKETKTGTGNPLVFEVNEAGTYTVEGSQESFTKLMSGSAVVNAMTGFRLTREYNYTATYTYLEPTTSVEAARSIVNVTYYDGLEREIQKVAVGASPDGSDIVQPVYQRSFGKNGKTFLPFVKQNNFGSHVDGDTLPSNWNSVCGSTEAAHARGEEVYDNSPLERVIKQIGAGKNWHDNDRATRFEYSANVANEVRSWVVSPSGSLSSPGFYPAGSLIKNITIDEDGNKQEEFRDRADNIVLTVAYDGNEACKTYYVFDNKGLLRFVIPPAIGDKSSLTGDEIKKWCYSYSYDSQDRLIEKRLPGIEPEYCVFDANNRIVLHQTGNQRLSNKWSYNLYDVYNRVIESGECVISTALASLRVTVANSLNYTPVTKTPLVYNYFDNYSFPGVHAFIPTKNISGYVDADGIDNGYFDFVSGQKTGTKIKVLDETGTNWITQTIYYDSYQRVIQETKNLYPSGSSSVSFCYDFIGNITESKEWQTVNGMESVVDKKYTYDDRGRLKFNKLKVNNDTEITLAEFDYDGLGRLQSKKYHSGIETQTYNYNVRDWLTEITGNKFKEELRYEIALTGLDTSRYFNGNISFMSWQNGTETKQAYAYRYDGLGRLTRATYCNLSATNAISNKGINDVASITYDKNGNILSLQRKKNGTLVDNLTYGYNGNLLQNVLDASTSVVPGGYPHTTGTLADQKYVHDANGNLTKDLNNKITAVSYNFINLPKQVTKDGQMISYVYSATGEKLQAMFGNSNVLNYNGTFIRAGNSLKYIITEEGRYVMNGTNGVAEYHLKDHLGNVRVVLNSAGNLIQSNSYYPFGSQLSQSGSSDNRYLFNSKEQQEISNWIDYGWRMYDGVIGRWGGIDKLSEKMYPVSCFAYGLNNPVKYKDLFGLLPTDPIVRHYIMLDEVVVTANRTYVNPFSFLYPYVSTGNKMKEQSQKWSEGIQKLDNVISQLESAVEVNRWRKGIQATMEFGNYLGVGASTISGLKYSPDVHIGNFYLRKGFWRTANGKVNTLEYLSKVAMGKNKGMYNALQNSLNMAKTSVKYINYFGNAVGYVSLGYTGYSFVKTPTVEGGFDTAAGIASIFFWEVGAIYTGSKIFYNGMQNYYTTMRENGFTPGLDDQIIWK